MKRSRKQPFNGGWNEAIRMLSGVQHQQQPQRMFIGIDNGVTGAVTIMDETGRVLVHEKTPVKRCLNYTKKKAFINRVNSEKLTELLLLAGQDPYCMIERPMVNPGRFAATISAVRCTETTEETLDRLKIPYEFIDSGEWQKKLLPAGLKGDDLKLAADSVARRLYPRIKMHNPDSVLIALYCQRKKMNIK